MLRILYIPLGLIKKMVDLALDGSRDFYNKRKFKKSIIDKNCKINNNSIIHPNCHVLENCYILNSIIKSYSYVGRNSMLQNVEIGRFCSVSNDVFIGLGKHPINHFSTSPLFYKVHNTFNINVVKQDLDFNDYEPIVIGNDVWIGARSIILDGVKIGNGAVVAANSVVTKDVPAYSVVGGTPAKHIKYRFSQEKILQMENIKWWDWDLEKIKENMNYLNYNA